MSNKRKYISTSNCYTRFSGRKLCGDVESHGASRAIADRSSPPSFTKVLTDYQLHTSIRNCFLILPKHFCDEHRVARHVTMTDSTGHTHWHMLCTYTGSSYRISNGWREFAYDHSLKLHNELVFTLVSSSHFVVRFATRKMLPTRDGKHYPWRRRKHFVKWQNYSENVQGRGEAATVLRKPSKRKDPEGTSSTRHSRRLVRRKYSEAGLKGASASSGSPDTRKAPSFTKLLTSRYAIHTSTRACCVSLPRQFCEEHNVPDHVTMTDPTRHNLWHMQCQNRLTNRGIIRIGKGWREFAYAHSLKLNDKLVFILLSPAHFLVDYTTGGMRPTRDGKKYPLRKRCRGRRTWPVDNPENVQGVAKAATVLTQTSKQTPEGANLNYQCSTSKMEIGKRDYKDLPKRRFHLPQLTYMECKNPDGTTYIHLLDNDGEVKNEDS